VTIAYGDITGRWLASRAAAEAAAGQTPEWWTSMTPGSTAEATVAEPIVAEPATSAEPAIATAETPPPVAWGEPASEAPSAPVAAAAATTNALGGVTQAERRVYVLGVLIVGLLLLIPSFTIAAPSLGNLGTFGLGNVPAQDRGKILAGTERDAANPCAPKQQATEFDSTDTIYVGGYFSRAVLPGQAATVHVFVDGDERASAPLNARGQLVACYYEQEALTGLSPAEYRILVDDATGVLAEGMFTVR
jgi:hypothetical protein